MKFLLTMATVQGLDKYTKMAYAGSHSTSLPACNRLLERKWNDKKLHDLQQRLRSTRSTVDNKAPKDYQHIRQNRKKAQLEEERMAVIQRHNNQLLHKMDTIMHTTGRVDHRNMDWKPKRSLNFVKKNEEISRVMKENQTLLKRIQGARPQYSIQNWELDFQRHRSMSKNISLLPPVKAQVRTRAKTLPCELEISAGRVKLPPINSHTSRPETEYSDIQEEIIDVEQPITELKSQQQQSNVL